MSGSGIDSVIFLGGGGLFPGCKMAKWQNGKMAKWQNEICYSCFVIGHLCIDTRVYTMLCPSPYAIEYTDADGICQSQEFRVR